MFEWIRFCFVAFFIISGLFCFLSEVIGVYKFGFIMNRIHAGGIGDTLGLFCIIIGLAIHSGIGFDLLKLLLVVCFMWLTSPTSTHMLGLVEYGTNEHLYKYVERDENVVNKPTR